jgi:hypothetical protein
MNLHHMMLVYVNSYDIMKSYIKWCWCPFSSEWNHHIKLLATILRWLRKNGFTIGLFTWPSEKLTGLDNGLRHNVNTLEKEHQCHTPHGLTLQCHRTVHVHWLCNLLSYMSQKSCTYHYTGLIRGLITYFMDRQNADAFVQCMCLWLQEHSLSWS